MVAIALLGAVALFGSHGNAPAWMGHDRDADQTYIRHMTTHHAQGIELARLAVARARDPHLQKPS